jgi:hypothetical protein
MTICKTDEQRTIWDVVEKRIDAAPKDGLNAEGNYVESIFWTQQGYISGLRAGRLAAISAMTADMVNRARLAGVEGRK